MTTNKIIKYINIDNRSDGFGAQLYSRMTAIAYCYINNKTYLHTPFRKMQHIQSDQYIKKLELFCGMSHESNNAPFYKKLDPRIKTVQVIKEIALSKEPDSHFTPEVRNILRDKYYSSNKPKIHYYNNQKINVALHIRRNDILNIKWNNARYTHNELYLDVLNKIEKISSNNEYHVFSDGAVQEFDIFSQIQNITLHLNKDLMESFHGMVTADYLIPAKSSLSYSAALLSQNRIITNCMSPFYTLKNEIQCTPLKRWLRL